jgi:hypothetical protein
LLVRGVFVFEERAKGCSPLRQVLVYFHVSGPRGGTLLAGVGLVKPPVAGEGSGVVLGSAGRGLEAWGWVSSVS